MIPRLAEVVANAQAIWKVSQMWETHKAGLFDEKNHKMAEIHALLSALKVITTESSTQTLIEARKACGGLGFSKLATFSFRIDDHQVQETYEGDNNVLIQQAAKYLLDLAKAKFKGKKTESMACESWLEITPQDKKFSGDLQEALEWRMNKMI